MMPDPRTALDSLLESGPRPRLTWTGHGERLELSGRVCAIWASKIANLLLEEDLAGPQARVLLDLPPHWRTLTWALGTWLAGARVVLPPLDLPLDHDGVSRPGVSPAGGPSVDPDVDLVVTSRPQLWVAHLGPMTGLAAVPLPSFALRWPGALPAGVSIDGAADVAAQGDALGPVPPFDPDAVALERPDGASRTFGELDLDAWDAVRHVLTWSRGEMVTLP